jgi:hypothetical protein
MTAGATSVAILLIWDHRPSAAEIDEMACEFFRLEAKLDNAYKTAIELDQPLEDLRERLILTVEQFGEAYPQKEKFLHGVKTELVATFNGTPTLLVRPGRGG